MALRDFELNWFGLTDRVAIITGGNTGLGQAYSVALASATRYSSSPTPTAWAARSGA